jgi:hypothetical protein
MRVLPRLGLVLLAAGCTGSIATGPDESGTAGQGTPGSSSPGMSPTGTGSPTQQPGGAGPAPAGSGPASAAACGGRIPAAPAFLRRLSPDEYVNTARDLLSQPMAAPRIEPPVGNVITALEVEKLNLAAADLVALKGHYAYAPCNVSGAFDAACADAFIAAFGRVAFRRPLDADEKTWLRAAYDRARTLAVTPAVTFRESLDNVAHVLLQSPQLVYVQETGIADKTLPAGTRRLSGYERATRLSYLFWSTTPDKALLDAAEAGKLDTAAGVRTEAERLIASPRAHKMVRSFASDWMELNGTVHHPAIESFEKDAKRFPFDGPALRAAWRADTESLYEKVFFEMNGSFKALMTSTQAYVNGPLAQLYGVTSVAKTATDYQWVSLDPSKRAGLLTRGGYLAVQSTADTQDPIHRGVFVLRHVLCQALPDPPADVDNTPPKPVAGQKLSTRQLVDAKTQGSLCQSCHGMVNPIGYTLANYDAMGGFQANETIGSGTAAYTVPIDATAPLTAPDITGTVAGGPGLAAKLADSGLAHDCAVKKWFVKALARAPGDDDQCAVTQLTDRFRKSDDLRDLVLALASSDADLFIKEPTP